VVPVDGVAHAVVSCVSAGDGLFQVSFTGPSALCAAHCTLLTAGSPSSACRWGCVQPPSTPLRPLPLPSAPFNVPAKDGVYLVHATADYAHSLSIGQLMRHAAAVFAKCDALAKRFTRFTFHPQLLLPELIC